MNSDITETTTTQPNTPSKLAIHIMNTTGLCAHPAHHHSFTAVGSSSIFAPAAGVSLLSGPKVLFVGTFHKCVACRERLGGGSEGMEMLCCVACGVYAHRCCAFGLGDVPGCLVNGPIVEAALRSRKQKTICEGAGEMSTLTESPRTKSSWYIFGINADDGHESKADSAPEDGADHEHLNEQHNGHESNDENNNMKEQSISNSVAAKSSWSIFGRRADDEKEIKTDDVSSDVNHKDNEQSHDSHGSNGQNSHSNEPSMSNSPAAKSSWSIFEKKSNDTLSCKENETISIDCQLDEPSDVPKDNHKISHNVEPSVTNSPTAKSSWSIFGRKGDQASNCTEKAVKPLHQNLNEHNVNHESNKVSNSEELHLADSPTKSSWSLFGKKSNDTSSCNENETASTIHDPLHVQASPPKHKSPWFSGKTKLNKVDNDARVDSQTFPIEEPADQSCNNDEIDDDSDPPTTWCSPSSPWSLFGKKATKNETESNDATDGHKTENDTHKDKDSTINTPKNKSNNEASLDEELSNSALEEVLASDPIESSTEVPDVPPKGAFRTSVEIIKKTSQTSANIPKAYTVGMVAGGVAGLAIAGPAGVIVGSQIGKTVLAVGAAVEGGMSIGVLAMGLVAASKYSNTKDSRELELPGQCSLVLVRPDVEVDPIWADYATEAREKWDKVVNDGHKSWGGGFGHLFSSDSSSEQTVEIRYHRDEDIITADGSELAMREKVFLLVNRILNDKMSLPGYVYRYLIRKCIVRGCTDEERNLVSDESTSLIFPTSQSCRQDAHGVIKHVTATLLEVRKGLASSPALTEMSAVAVEVLVFGELYNDVFREIVQQTREQRDKFLEKIEAFPYKFESPDSQQEIDEKDHLSKAAISSLKMLPEAHTTADKLFYAVQFLEFVSEHFSTLFKDRCIDADALLKMVCQHIIAASDVNLHAEVAFLEEFSRDQQLLRGKEGYALITLQASLHYLDSVEVFDSDLCLR